MELSDRVQIVREEVMKFFRETPPITCVLYLSLITNFDERRTIETLKIFKKLVEAPHLLNWEESQIMDVSAVALEGMRGVDTPMIDSIATVLEPDLVHPSLQNRGH